MAWTGRVCTATIGVLQGLMLPVLHQGIPPAPPKKKLGENEGSVGTFVHIQKKLWSKLKCETGEGQSGGCTFKLGWIAF